ncbi:Uncharacterized protein APZ42_011691 [Daphnia magna]|uniref:Uncharacterized protein n=1 Tax=Daphnia magna TaxID=35525 RepID=A0A0P5SSF9_9CRUS|nr:Uncharacterized protein APZ42_011691 [Daphnia magna]
MTDQCQEDSLKEIDSSRHPGTTNSQKRRRNAAEKETTSTDEEIREPVREGHDCKLFCICTGKENDVPQYLYVPHFQKKENKRPIYQGYYKCDVPAAIVQIELLRSGTTKKEIDRELLILKELEVHENFIRYFTHEMNKDFVFIATELCLCSVADLLDPALEGKIPMADKIREELRAKEILRQATNGLNYLHKNNFVHRNIKPNNFLIKEVKTGDKSCRFVVKITDFRLTRKRDPHKNEPLSQTVASEGWKAPESGDLTKDLSTKLDVFILGCFYHYVLVALSKPNNGKPRHPFGDSMRTYNINDRDYFSKRELPFVSNDEEEAKVVDLIKKMLMFNEEDRPTLQQVLKDDYFEPSKDYKIYNDEDKSKKPGLCVIFNQEKFEDPKQFRGGSDIDRDELTRTFKKLGFDVEIHNNLTSGSLIFEIEDLAKERNFNDYGCLVVCLLSHGIENAILGYDGRFVNTNELKYQFSLDNCPSLYGKPKVFIIQACQGKLEQSKTGIEATSENEATDDLDDSIVKMKSYIEPKYDEEKKLKKELKNLKISDDARRNPPLMDFLTIKATLPGFIALRVSRGGEYLGSIFIQNLCDTLSGEYLGNPPKPTEGRKHLEGLLKDVQPRMNEISEKIESWQTMYSEACLSKNIRFREAETEGNVVVKNEGEDYQVFT